MKRKLILLATFLFLSWVGTAGAVTLSIDPAFQNVGVGGTASVNLNISGLGSDNDNTLGGFILDVGFDNSILAFDSAVFGPTLDLYTDPSDPIYNNYSVDQFSPDTVSLYWVTFLDTADLIANQLDSFVLATLKFTGIGLGTSSLTFDYIDLSNGDGTGSIFADGTAGSVTVAPVPEPSTWLLMAMGLVGLVGARRKFVKS